MTYLELKGWISPSHTKKMDKLLIIGQLLRLTRNNNVSILFDVYAHFNVMLYFTKDAFSFVQHGKAVKNGNTEKYLVHLAKHTTKM